MRQVIRSALAFALITAGLGLSACYDDHPDREHRHDGDHHEMGDHDHDRPHD